MTTVNLAVEEIVRAWTAIGQAHNSIFAEFAPVNPALPYLIFSSLGTGNEVAPSGNRREVEQFEFRVRSAIEVVGETPIDVYMDFREFVAGFVDELRQPFVAPAVYGPDLVDQVLLGAMNDQGYLERSVIVSARA